MVVLFGFVVMHQPTNAPLFASLQAVIQGRTIRPSSSTTNRSNMWWSPNQHSLIFSGLVRCVLGIYFASQYRLPYRAYASSSAGIVCAYRFSVLTLSGIISPSPGRSHRSYSCARPCSASSRRARLPSQCGQRAQAWTSSSADSRSSFSYTLRFVCFAAEYRFAFTKSCANRHMDFGLPLFDCSVLSISPAMPCASYASRQR